MGVREINVPCCIHGHASWVKKACRTANAVDRLPELKVGDIGIADKSGHLAQRGNFPDRVIALVRDVEVAGSVNDNAAKGIEASGISHAIDVPGREGIAGQHRDGGKPWWRLDGYAAVAPATASGQKDGYGDDSRSRHPARQDE